MRYFLKPIVIIFSFILAVSDYLSISKLIETSDLMKQYPYENTATIDYIGLPDGIVYVSYYDDQNILQKDVVVQKTRIQGSLSRVESFYGKEIPIRLNPEKNEIIWIDDYPKLWIKAIVKSLILLVIGILYLFTLRRNLLDHGDGVNGPK